MRRDLERLYDVPFAYVKRERVSVDAMSVSAIRRGLTRSLGARNCGYLVHIDLSGPENWRSVTGRRRYYQRSGSLTLFRRSRNRMSTSQETRPTWPHLNYSLPPDSLIAGLVLPGDVPLPRNSIESPVEFGRVYAANPSRAPLSQSL